VETEHSGDLESLQSGSAPSKLRAPSIVLLNTKPGDEPGSLGCESNVSSELSGIPNCDTLSHVVETPYPWAGEFDH
jgi:hypothetical protein